MMTKLFLTLLAALPLAAGAQPTNRPPKYPWHLVNAWWTSPAATGEFEELAIPFEVVGDVPNGVDLYIAPLGLVQIGASKAYGGVQTTTRGWPRKEARNTVVLGKGGIFSLWSPDNRPISLAKAEGPEGTHFEAADYENNFLSVRRRADWGAGKYTYTLRRKATEAGPSSGAWFSAAVTNHSTGVRTEIGSLYFDGSSLSLGKDIAAFVEVYGNTSVIPSLAIIFDEPLVDGRRRPGTNVTLNYPSNNTNGEVRFATAFATDRRVYIYLVPSGIKDGKQSENLR